MGNQRYAHNKNRTIYLVTRATSRVPAGSDAGYFNEALEPLLSVLYSSYQIVPCTALLHCTPLMPDLSRMQLTAKLAWSHCNVRRMTHIPLFALHDSLLHLKLHASCSPTPIVYASNAPNMDANKRTHHRCRLASLICRTYWIIPA